MHLHKTVLRCITICWWDPHRRAIPCPVQSWPFWHFLYVDPNSWRLGGYKFCPEASSISPVQCCPLRGEWGFLLLLLLTETRITWELLCTLLAYGPSCSLLFLSCCDLEHHMCDGVSSKSSSGVVSSSWAVSVRWHLLAQWVPDSDVCLQCQRLLCSNLDLVLHKQAGN